MADLVLKDLLEVDVKVVRDFRYSILSVELQRPMVGVPLYWRQIDPELSLVEVGISEDEGYLVSVTVPHYGGLLHPHTTGTGRITGPGLPVFEPLAGQGGGVNKNLFDTPGRCWFEMGSGLLRLALSDAEVDRSILIAEGFLAELDSADRLLGFRLNDLSPKELTEIVNGIKVLH